jgi:hypothetical protein
MLTVSMALAGVLVMATPANAAIDRPVAIWQMNEAAGSQTMVDSSGNGRNGVIGASVQEGTALPGGYWKFQQPSGKIACLFRGSGGSSTASAGSTVRVNDGNWHTVRCERTSSMVTMIIDGVVTGRNRNATGNISNTRPVTIAGKGNCDQVEITCDYFSGDIDYVRIETS